MNGLYEAHIVDFLNQCRRFVAAVVTGVTPNVRTASREYALLFVETNFFSEQHSAVGPSKAALEGSMWDTCT